MPHVIKRAILSSLGIEEVQRQIERHSFKVDQDFMDDFVEEIELWLTTIRNDGCHSSLIYTSSIELTEEENDRLEVDIHDAGPDRNQVHLDDIEQVVKEAYKMGKQDAI